MQNCTTILGIIDMRQRGISYDDCRSRYKIGCSAITLNMNRFKESGMVSVAAMAIKKACSVRKENELFL